METKVELLSSKNNQPSPFSLRPWPGISDAVIAVFSLGVTILLADTTAVAGYFLFLVANTAIAWRRTEPILVQGIILLASALSMASGYSTNALFPLAISLYCVGRYTSDDRWSFIGVGAALVLLLGDTLLDLDLTYAGAIRLIMPFTVWYIGRRMRVRGEHTRLLEERAAYLEQRQTAESEKAVAVERTRIARELHDIVAHQVSLMTIQAAAAKTVVTKDPVAAIQAISSVENAGRHALDELRHLLGVLRPDKEKNTLSPQPGHADIPQLILELEKTGLNVSLKMDPIESPLPARVDLSIYRIVQEALTNVLKHAGAEARAEVSVSSDTQCVTIVVRDDGKGNFNFLDSGHGIAGMRERAQMLGGSLAAGPLPVKGFEVIARLPISKDSH